MCVCLFTSVFASALCPWMKSLWQLEAEKGDWAGHVRIEIIYIHHLRIFLTGNSLRRCEIIWDSFTTLLQVIWIILRTWVPSMGILFYSFILFFVKFISLEIICVCMFVCLEHWLWLNNALDKNCGEKSFLTRKNYKVVVFFIRRKGALNVYIKFWVKNLHFLSFLSNKASLFYI